MYKILVIDFSIYKNNIIKVYQEKGYDVIHSESAYDAITKLKTYDFDLVVSEVELPGDNAFDLYNFITKNYPYIPIIMTTDKPIDTFFNNIFDEGIGNVLCKPLKKNELLNLSQKLITKKNIFGLNNYMDDIIEIKKIKITNSKQIKTAVAHILNEIENWGFIIEKKLPLNLVLNELTINAVYHSHGLTREKEARIPVGLKENESVDLFFARSKDKFGFAINDYNGILTKKMILNTINNVIVQENLLTKAYEEGEDVSELISDTGRGIDLVRKLVGEYYFIIKKNVRTEIILIFDNNYKKDDTEKYSSLKIIEDLT